MVIDIIDYTEQQLAMLTIEAIEKVRTAQAQKDRLTSALEKRLDKEKRAFMDGGAYLSTIWDKREAELRAEYDGQVDVIREGLLFYLHYLTVENLPEVSTTVPYPVDYALNTEERMKQVRAYYLEAYDDPTERFNKFREDSFAKTYLGELYAPLYHYFEECIYE